MKKRISLLFLFIISVLLITYILPGCNSGTYYKPNQISPDKVELTRVAVNDEEAPSNLYHFIDISQIIGGNNYGELLGFLWNDTKTVNPEQLVALYLIDPAESTAYKVFQPHPGFRIYSAVIDKDWIAFVEQSKTDWMMYSINRKTNEIKKLDAGSYFTGGGLDYPTLALYDGILSYNKSVKATDAMISTMEIINLNTGNKSTVHKVEGLKQYLGPPGIYKNYLVFHRGEWTKEMKSEVYLYNVKDGTLEQISRGHMAVKPSIWGNNVVWSGYSSDIPETKNIILYDILTKKSESITDATPANKYEYWGATISHGIITWNRNLLPHIPTIYSTLLNEKRELNREGNQVAVYGSWLTWRNPAESIGTYIVGLSSFFPALDLSGDNQIASVLPFSLGEISREKLHGLSPPESLVLYYEALSNNRFDIVDEILSHTGTLGTREDVIKEMRNFWEKNPSPRKVSTDFFIEGDKAYVGEITDPNNPIKHHLTKEDGIWKVDILSAQ